MSGMFGRRKKGPAEAQEQVPRYLEAWGWAASAARFRGVMAILSSVTCLLAVAALLYVVRTSQTIVVGMDGEGRPVQLERTAANLNLEVYCRDFVGLMFSYSPKTVEMNSIQAMVFATPPLRAAFAEKFGRDFLKSVKDNQVTQVINVRQVVLDKLQPDGGFSARIAAQKLRSDKVLNSTTDSQVLIEISVVRGAVTKENPWGLYVNSLNETQQSASE